jgi:hypothetical protein
MNTRRKLCCATTALRSVDGRAVCAPKRPRRRPGELDGPLWVVKAQIHAGWPRQGPLCKEADAGEKGGVRLAKSVEEAEAEAKAMLGRTLVTHQTGPAGKVVNRIYIEDGSGIERELYLALLVDRASSRISFVCSTEGGMDIEEVAASTPEKILSFSVDPATGYQAFHGRRIAFALGLEGKQVKQCVALMGIALQAFVEKDMEMLEINPLIVTDTGELVPRRQARLRRQRALPPSRHRRAARRDRGGPQGTRRLQARPELHRARRRDRLHGQRRGPRHGDDGHHQALRLRTRQLPRRGRRRHEGEGDRGVQDHHLGPEREGHPRQHLRRHHALRHHRRRAWSRR